jgi:thiosulfate dehydrogenase
MRATLGKYTALIAVIAVAMAPAFAQKKVVKFSPPTEMPKGEFGKSVAFGQAVFDHTQTVAKDFVGNSLTCENCHLDRGRLAHAAPMWAAFVSYPQYRSKTHEVNTIEDRIQDCFRYSMNGKAPPHDSKVLTGLVSYLYWLATGAPVGGKLEGALYPRLPKPVDAPDPGRGAKVYAAHCAFCHGAGGEGRMTGDAYVFPPLWGAKSYNWGAGMTGLAAASGFIKTNMPLGLGGSLSDQDAWDVAAFVDSHPRPQDPRFTGNIDETRRKFHGADDYYGKTVGGIVLGAPESIPH